MLKITTETTTNATLVKLEGTIRGPWVEELNKACAESMKELGKRNLVVEMAGVGFADAAGRELLIHIRNAGAELKGASPFLRQLLDGDHAKSLGNSEFDKGGK
jgi:anti-anti-sigma regulatory factor